MLTHVLIRNSLPFVFFWNEHREGINLFLLLYPGKKGTVLPALYDRQDSPA